MNKKYLTIWVTLLALIVACSDQPVEMKHNPFSGLWYLSIMEQQDPETGDWLEWRDGMQGYILYHDDGTMAVHLTVKDYEKTDLRFSNFTDTISVEALKHLTGSYVYFADYNVIEEESVVEHQRISHSNPGDWGAKVRRRYVFSGDTLILAPMEEQNASLRLKWVKAK